MTPLAGRSIALIALLSSGAALYRRSYFVGAALGGVTCIALSSIQAEREKRPPQKMRLSRSSSSPALLGSSGQCTPRLRSIELLQSSPFKPSLPHHSLSNQPRAWSTAVWKEEELISNRSSPPPLSLSSLPRRGSSFLEKMKKSEKHVEVVRNEIVDGILKMESQSLLNWKEIFPGDLPSLEIGDVTGAARRTRLAGGAWVVVADYWRVAQEIRRGRGNDELLLHPLIIYQNVFGFTLSFLANARFKRIDLRLLGSPRENLNLFAGQLAQILEDGGELRLIIKRCEFKYIKSKKESMNKYGFAPPEELWVDEELVEEKFFGFKKTLSQQLHLIYRGMR